MFGCIMMLRQIKKESKQHLLQRWNFPLVWKELPTTQSSMYCTGITNEVYTFPWTRISISLISFLCKSAQFISHKKFKSSEIWQVSYVLLCICRSVYFLHSNVLWKLNNRRITLWLTLRKSFSRSRTTILLHGVAWLR